MGAPFVTGHDHRDAALHQHLVGMTETDWEPMGGTPATMAGVHALAIADGTLFAVAWGEQYGAGGLWLYDIRADPHDPAFLAYLPLPGPVGGDRALGVTPDGDFAVVGVEDVPVTLYWGGPANPTPPGLVLVDVRIPGAPVVVGYAPAELGIHSVTMHRIGGEDYVFATNLGFLTPSIYRIERSPVPRLVASAPIFGRSLAIGHDATAYDDPILGKPLLATADGADFSIWDVSSPFAPVRLARWRESSTYTHSAILTTVEGKRLLVGSSEDWGDVPSKFWVIDATNLSALKLHGSWTAPVAPSPGWLRFSLHNPRIDDGTLYFAHYHAGVLGFDISTLAKAADPQVSRSALTAHDTGYANPVPEAMRHVGWGGVDAPYVLDVEVDPASGAVYAADTFFGITTYRADP